MFFFFFYLETLLQKPKIVFQLSVDDVRHRCAQRDGGSEDRSLVPVITYKEFSAQMGSATCSPDETHFFSVVLFFFFLLLYSVFANVDRGGLLYRASQGRGGMASLQGQYWTTRKSKERTTSAPVNEELQLMIIFHYRLGWSFRPRCTN